MDDRPNLFEIPWTRLFPWVRLFRAPAAAVESKRLVIALAGLVALQVLWGLLDGSMPARTVSAPTIVFGGSLEPLLITEPFNRLSEPFVRIFQPPVRYAELLHNALAAVAALAVWGLCGGAIARIAAFEQAKGEKISLKTAVKFAIKHAATLIGAPLVPLFAVLFVAFPVAVFGLLYRLGSIGSTIAGVLAFVPLIGGFVLTLILLGLAAGWPLMIASAAVEGEDSFDAMSRTYAYVRQRPWHYVGYALLTFAIGALAWLFVDLFARSVVQLAYWALTLTAPESPLGTFVLPQAPGAVIDHGHAFWLAVVGTVARAWIYAYFWTAATTVYLLLRRDIDGTPLNLVDSTSPQMQANDAHDVAPAPLVEGADKVATV